MPRGRPKKNVEIIKETPLSEESQELVDKGLQEVSEEKLESIEDEDNEETTKSKEEKLKIAKRVMQQINRSAEEDVVTFGDVIKQKERISWGVPEIDSLTGGAVAGSYVIIFGGESVGKSTLVLHQITDAQTKNKVCAYLDLEHKFDVDRAVELGVNLEELILIENVSNAEEAMDYVIKFAHEKCVDYIAIDSVQAMSPHGEQEDKKGVEKSIEDDEIALLARKMSKFLRVCAPSIAKAKIAIVLVGQLRTGGIGTYCVTNVLTGGMALKHWATIILAMRKGTKSDAPEEKTKTEDGKTISKQIGFDSVLKVEKMHITGGQPELSELHLPFYFSSGFIKGDK